ncbi:MAG: NAD(P)H-hydrate dehydratase [Candidatus Omnitrophica bacterium]|nr:NAD(P)H-hydrate dehydratase [Candidatus Omnitrophota bacterium]MDD5487426.1 NAD(P)H-hydrate dehydratase [Candidatus Omnitrophota bacterium]
MIEGHDHIGAMRARRADAHKGDLGKVLVIAGSSGMTGAAFLCSQAALRSGSGLVTCGVPSSLNDIMEVKLTEVMTVPLPETKNRSLSSRARDSIMDLAVKADVVAIGPGLGREEETRELVLELLGNISIPVVLDADGLNALGGETELLRKRTYRTVITPHPGEMARLLTESVDFIQENRTEVAKRVAEVTGAIVCLKGHGTIVASPEGGIYRNVTGNSGMATGGTGDVLTGMVASFIGQGLDDYGATVCAVYLHGLAGDIAAEKMGQSPMIASDLIDCLPEAFKKAGI